MRWTNDAKRRLAWLFFRPGPRWASVFDISCRVSGAAHANLSTPAVRSRNAVRGAVRQHSFRVSAVLGRALGRHGKLGTSVPGAALSRVMALSCLQVAMAVRRPHRAPAQLLEPLTSASMFVAVSSRK